MSTPDGIRYPVLHKEPTKLSSVGQTVLERLRRQTISMHELYLSEGFEVLGSVSEYDPAILRAGEKVHILAARRSAGNAAVQRLQEDYEKKGIEMDVVFERGAVHLKRRRRQKDVASEKDFSVHESGLTVYGRRKLPEMQPRDVVPLHIPRYITHTNLSPRRGYPTLPAYMVKINWN